MLVNLNDVLIPAREHHYAVGLFNAVNSELARGILQASKKAKSPVIVGTAQVLFPYGSMEEVADMLLPQAKRADVPVVLHLDHGLDAQTCLRALELGYTSIMYDCSCLPYEENVSEVREMAKAAHAFGATIEAELGHVGDNGPAPEDGSGEDPARFYTDPKQAKDYVEKTGVDALAIAVGTAHGMYRLPPKLDFNRIEEIAREVHIPLVLHGGSGLTDRDFKEAIRCGISKINIFTDINLAAAQAMRQAPPDPKTGLTDLIPGMVEAVEETALKKMKLFGSVNWGVV